MDNIQELWLEYIKTRDQRIRNILIEKYIPLVKIITNKLSISLPTYVDRDDCASEGYIGLIQAIERFNPNLGYKFETFASIRIKGAIIDSLRAKDWVPTAIRQKVRKFNNAVSELESQLGRVATEEELCEHLKLDAQQLSNLLKQIQVVSILSLEEFANICDLHVDNISDVLEKQETIEVLGKVIDQLSEKERLVITLYYYEELTLREISYIMKLSEARISQLHTKAVFSMRTALMKLQ